MKKEEPNELKHKAVPGYKPVFYIIFSLCAAYLALIFIMYF